MSSHENYSLPLEAANHFRRCSVVTGCRDNISASSHQWPFRTCKQSNHQANQSYWPPGNIEHGGTRHWLCFGGRRRERIQSKHVLFHVERQAKHWRWNDKFKERVQISRNIVRVVDGPKAKHCQQVYTVGWQQKSGSHCGHAGHCQASTIRILARPHCSWCNTSSHTQEWIENRASHELLARHSTETRQTPLAAHGRSRPSVRHHCRQQDARTETVRSGHLWLLVGQWTSPIATLFGGFPSSHYSHLSFAFVPPISTHLCGRHEKIARFSFDGQNQACRTKYRASMGVRLVVCDHIHCGVHGRIAHASLFE